MSLSRRVVMKAIVGGVAGLIVGPKARALNPQPEVPSKSSEAARSRPKELNPQPEVPSKSGSAGGTNPRELNPQPEVSSKDGPGGWTDPKELNPQPEVPSKPKKSKTLHREKTSVPPKQP